MRLLEPLPLGSCTLRNRVVFGPHETNLGTGRRFSPRHLAYYRRRAAGGAGMIVLEEASVVPSDWPYERCPLASANTEEWAVLAETLHDEGAVAVAAIGHTGGQGASAYSQTPLLAPSRVPEVAGREAPEAMETEDIATVVAGFGRAAALAVRAGLDGVEVNAGQHSLVRQFLSGLTNHRQDDYGEDRLRFAREVLESVRRAVGDAVVGLRLSCDELAPGAGIVPEAAADIARAFATVIDYLVVVRGSIDTAWATRPDMHVPPGFNLELARELRAALPSRVAVVAQGSIVEVGMAEQALSDGVCDAVEMTRAQIADPDVVAKAASGRAHRIRPCILCNQGCQVHDVRNLIVSCVVEPSAGYEDSDSIPEGPAARPVDVLVVGGGPAGLECARVAALRGHRVRLVERRSRPGGMLRVAAVAEGRTRLTLLADWLENECRHLGVEIVSGVDVDARDLAGFPGTAVVCTGSRPGSRSYDVDEGARVLPAGEFLETLTASLAGLEPGPVVVWDPIGGPIGVSVAETLAAQRPVVLVTPDLVVGQDLAHAGDLAPGNGRLHALGVRLIKRSVLRRVRADAVEVEDRLSGAREAIDAVALIDADHRLPEDRLWREAEGATARAGDAVAPRTVLQAVLEGRWAAVQLPGPR